MSMAGSSKRLNAMPIEERRALLARAYDHGQTILELTVIGKSYSSLESYVGSCDDLEQSDTENGKKLTFADVVSWEITLDDELTILGYSQSGYGPLTKLLAVDFSGASFEAGN